MENFQKLISNDPNKLLKSPKLVSPKEARSVHIPTYQEDLARPVKLRINDFSEPFTRLRSKFDRQSALVDEDARALEEKLDRLDSREAKRRGPPLPSTKTKPAIKKP